MRIDAYNQIAAMYKTTKPSKVKNTAETASARDQVQISRAGRDYQIAKQAVAAASDIREDMTLILEILRANYWQVIKQHRNNFKNCFYFK